MLREAQHGYPETDDFARVYLRLFHKACQEVVTWHRTLGRRYFLEGHEPEAIKRIVDQDIEQARAELRPRLRGLLAWARTTGRM
jgi:hypothetical protein